MGGESMRSTLILSAILAAGRLFASAPGNVSLEKVVNHNNWGAAWDTSYVIENGIVTLTAVPKIGGRVMQYDLGDHPSIYVDATNKGQVPSDGNMMLGGFRQLASPQSDFGWPSGPHLDCLPYTCTIPVSSPDSTVIHMESDVENNDEQGGTLNGLQFKRTLTVYRGTSRVRVLMTMVNHGAQTKLKGIWGITQVVCSNNGSVDKTNIRVYFQRNPLSTLGSGNGYVRYVSEGPDETQWQPNGGGEGIMGVQYMQKTGKIGADCRAGWICYVDQLDGYAYARTFTYEDGETYPDSGASVQVYTYTDYPTLEVEVLGPLTTLAQNDSTRLEEIWYAARSRGPVVAVTAAGLVTRPLEVEQNQDVVEIDGSFGVFHEGKVRVQFSDNSGALVATVDSMNVTPAESLVVNGSYTVPAGASMLCLKLFDGSGNPVGALDSAVVQSTSICAGPHWVSPAYSGKFASAVARPDGTVNIAVALPEAFDAELFTVDGKRLSRFSATGPFRSSIHVGQQGSRLLLLRVRSAGVTRTVALCAMQRN